jgi:formamidopyrimidine-DNA glycosylase
MPELPEVHTISQDLKNNVVGFEIKNIQIAKNYRIPDDQ